MFGFRRRLRFLQSVSVSYHLLNVPYKTPKRRSWLRMSAEPRLAESVDDWHGGWIARELNRCAYWSNERYASFGISVAHIGGTEPNTIHGSISNASVVSFSCKLHNLFHPNLRQDSWRESSENSTTLRFVR